MKKDDDDEKPRKLLGHSNDLEGDLANPSQKKVCGEIWSEAKEKIPAPGIIKMEVAQN